MTKLKSFESFADYGNFIGSADDSMLPLVSSIGNDTVCYVSKPGLDNNVSGGESDGGGIKYTYYDISRLSVSARGSILPYMLLAKLNTSSSFEVIPAAAVIPSNYDISGLFAVATDLSAKVIVGGQSVTIADVFSYEPELMAQLTEITEEEFYRDPNALEAGTFMVMREGVDMIDKIYRFDEGMTWADWCASPYNTGGYRISDYADGVVVTDYADGFDAQISVDGNGVIHSDLVKSMKYEYGVIA